MAVRSTYGNREVKARMCEWSGLSPSKFVLVMDAISCKFSISLSWVLLHPDNFAVIADTEQELVLKVNTWKQRSFWQEKHKG